MESFHSSAFFQTNLSYFWKVSYLFSCISKLYLNEWILFVLNILLKQHITIYQDIEIIVWLSTPSCIFNFSQNLSNKSICLSKVYRPLQVFYYSAWSLLKKMKASFKIITCKSIQIIVYHWIWISLPRATGAGKDQLQWPFCVPWSSIFLPASALVGFSGTSAMWLFWGWVQQRVVHSNVFGARTRNRSFPALEIPSCLLWKATNPVLVSSWWWWW